MRVNAEELRNVLNHQDLIKDFSEIGTIKKYAPSITIESLKKALQKAFGEIFMINFVLERFSDFELKLAERLVDKKYSTDEWNFRR